MIRRIAAITTLFTGFAVLALFVQMLWVAHSGRTCLTSVRQLVPGVSTVAQVTAIEQQFPASVNNSGACNTGKCSVKFSFQSWASRLHIVSPSGQEAEIVIRKGTVASVDLMYSQEKSVLVALAEGGDRFRQ